ncbi:MAG: flagellar hook-associated protein FlgK [Phycisphaeraceae bacterium]
MGLTSSLHIGRSGLLASQAAIQVAGNNLANIATEGYHRNEINLAAVRSSELQRGIFLGNGVQIASITRAVDEALEARLRNAVSDEGGSRVAQDLWSEIEAIENELSEIDISTRMGEFFNAWSQIANNPQDLSLRTLAVEQAETLSDYVRSVRGEFLNLQKRIDDRTANAGRAANDLLDRIAELNEAIAIQEGGQPTDAGGLRDQRDLYLTELAEYIDFSVNEQRSGAIDIFVGSLPIVIGNDNRGIAVTTDSVDGQLTTTVRLAEDRSPLDIRSGELGALIEFRDVHLENAIQTLDTYANAMIYEVNKIHSQSQGLNLLDSALGTTEVLDTTVALNDATAQIPFDIEHGSFQLHVTQVSTGQRISETIRVDLDGIDPTNDTSLDSLAASINAVANISATVTSDGRLEITADAQDFQFSFSDDNTGAVAALGINTFFTGKEAGDMNVNRDLVGDPRYIAVAREHLPGDNRGALAIASLRSTGVESLQGLSLPSYWNRHIEDVSIRTSQAIDQLNADSVVKENLKVQQQAISGVNADEETIDLMSYQRMYQANARFLNVVDELMQTLISIV